MPTSSPMKKTIELQANTSTPHGATIRLTVEYRIRPSDSQASSSFSEEVDIHQQINANTGSKGPYEKQGKFTYGTEHDPTPSRYDQKDPDYVSEKVIEHVSEDEKSTSSEEVFFEEWTEQFRCRRTDEYDRRTNQLLRSSIDETSGRVKGDIIKEQYKEKNTRIKGRKSYDVVRETHRQTPGRTYEEVPKPPPRSSSIPPRASSRDRQWTSEDTYTTEIVQDPMVARDLESAAQKFESSTHYERTRPSQIPAPARYDHVSNVVTPSAHYAEQRIKEQPEEVVSEEYQVEIETVVPRRDQTSDDNRADTYVTTGSQSPTRRNSDWRSKLKEIYTATSDEDQYKESTNGSYAAQRVSVIPSSTQQRFKEVQIRLPGHDRTPPEQRKYEPSPPSRHTVKEVLVCVPRGSSPEKPYHSSLPDEHESRRKRTDFLYSESPKKVSSDDDQPRSSSVVNEQRTSFEPTYSRVGELKNTFETTTTTHGSTRDDLTKYKTPINTGFTEQRRRIFEDQDWNQRSPINEFQSNERRISETHTAPSLVSDRISRIENAPSTTEYVSRRGLDIGKTSPPQISIESKYRSKQIISSMDSDVSGPIYSSTPKTYKSKQDDDAGHESEDELSDPKHSYDSRRRTSKTRLRDFSQSTQQPIDVTQTIHRATTNLDNVFTQVPTTKSESLSPSPGKSQFTSDSGVFDYSATGTSYQFPTNYQFPTGSSTWRPNVSTTITSDTPRSRDNGIYVDSTITSSPFDRRQTFDADQTTSQNIDESISRSTYKYDREILPAQQQQQQQQQRTVRRQLTHSSPSDYEHLTSYQSRLDAPSKVSITTQSRTIKPLVVDEYETVETKTQVECQVQRTNEIKESTTTERLASPSRKILTVTATATTTPHSSDETTTARRVLLNERPQYYESPRDERRFQPIQRDHSPDDAPRTSTMEVTSLSPTDQIRIGKKSANEIIAVVRVPELTRPTVRHGTSESNLYEKSREEERPRLHYQRVHATSYRPPILPQLYQTRPSRPRNGRLEPASDYSSPITLPIRSTSSHSNLHEQNQQSIPRSQTRYHSGSLGNLLGSNLEFEIEIEKRPPQQPEQPTSVSLDQCSRAIVTTSKDGRVSVQNIAAYPGNTVVINSDYHSSDRSLNRSSGYFSSDEPRSHGGHAGNYSSDEQSSGVHRHSPYISSPIGQHRSNEQTPISNGTRYHFDRVNEIVNNYSRSPNNFNDAIDQIDALYTNLDVQKNDQRPYDFSKLNRRKQLTQNPTEYSNRYTSTGFQQIPFEQPSSSSMPTPIRPSQSLSSSGILTDYGTPGSTYSSIQNLVVQQNRLNGQSQIVQRNRTSVKQIKQKNAAKRRNGNLPGQYSDGDDDDENDSPLSDNGRSQPSPRSYHYYQ